MKDDLGEAASIAAVGVRTVMLALTVLMIAIVLITRLASRGRREGDAVQTGGLGDGGPDRDTIAAMAAALALAVAAQQPTPAGPPADGAGPPTSRWAVSGRAQLMGARRLGPARRRDV